MLIPDIDVKTKCRYRGKEYEYGSTLINIDEVEIVYIGLCNN